MIYYIDKEDLDWLNAISILLKSKKYKELIQKIYSQKCSLAVEQKTPTKKAGGE